MGLLRQALTWPWRYLQDTHTTPANVEVRESIQPTIDVGARWPPNVGFWTETFVLANGTNTIILPPAESLVGALNPGAWPIRRSLQARRWLSLGFAYDSPGAGKAWQLSFLPSPGASFPTFGHTLVHYGGTAIGTEPMPLIRTTTITSGFQRRGLEHPVLVTNPNLLYVQGLLGVAAEEVVLSGIFVDGFSFEPLPDPWS